MLAFFAEHDKSELAQLLVVRTESTSSSNTFLASETSVVLARHQFNFCVDPATAIADWLLNELRSGYSNGQGFPASLPEDLQKTWYGSRLEDTAQEDLRLSKATRKALRLRPLENNVGTSTKTAAAAAAAAAMTQSVIDPTRPGPAR